MSIVFVDLIAFFCYHTIRGGDNLRERIKELRERLGLTQQKFSDRIGLKRQTIAAYEMGKIEPSDSTLLLLCKEFNVNEEWLRTGKGEIFLPESNDELKALAKKYNLSYGTQILIEKIVRMKESDQQVILNYCMEVSEALSAGNYKPITEEAATMEPIKTTKKPPLTESDIPREIEKYRAALELEVSQAEKLSALPKDA